MAFSRQEYWSGLPCPPPGYLPDPGIEPVSPESPALQADSLPLSQLGSPTFNILKDKTEENLNSYLLIHLKTIKKRHFMLTKLKYIYENCFPKAKYIW